jgi:hypothetical protein
MRLSKAFLLPFLACSLLGFSLESPCLSQEPSELEECLSSEVLARPEVAKILQQLRFLRDTDAQYGENHPKKAATQARMVEAQAALRSVLENLVALKDESKLETKSSSNASNTRSSRSTAAAATNLEDTLTKEMEELPEVAVIVRKLRFARLNIANLGEKHPKRSEVLKKIEEHELALRKILRLDTETSSATNAGSGPKDPGLVEDSLSQEVLDNENVSRLVRQLLHMRLIALSYSQNHPDRVDKLSQVEEQEETVIAAAKRASPRSILRKGKSEGQIPMLQKLESRSDVKSLINQLAILRLSLEGLRRSDAKYKIVEGRIREYESDLKELIKKP